MIEISDIVGAIRFGRIRITDHADEEAQNDAKEETIQEVSGLWWRT
jgi:hypothetical protein